MSCNFAQYRSRNWSERYVSFSSSESWNSASRRPDEVWEKLRRRSSRICRECLGFYGLGRLPRKIWPDLGRRESEGITAVHGAMYGPSRLTLNYLAPPRNHHSPSTNAPFRREKHKFVPHC